MKQAILSMYRDMKSRFQPEPLTSIHRDIAAEDALNVAIKEGEKLAQRFTAIISDAGEDSDEEDNLSDALRMPLSIVPNGSGDNKPGSLLRAACVGAAVGIGIQSLGNCYRDYSQVRVLHGMLAETTAEWEVGKEEAGHAPLPWKWCSDGSIGHLSYSPGALTGGKLSIAHGMLQYARRGCDSPQVSAARVAQAIAALLGLAEDPWQTIFSLVNKAEIPLRDTQLPIHTLVTLALEVLKIDPFWPEYLKGKKLAC